MLCITFLLYKTASNTSLFDFSRYGSAKANAKKSNRLEGNIIFNYHIQCGNKTLKLKNIAASPESFGFSLMALPIAICMPDLYI